MLQLRSIDAGYGSFQALFDISLEVNAGEAVAVIGPNGAGKTTLMRVDLRPDPPDARQHAHGRHRPRGHAGAPHRRTRHRARAGEPPSVRAHDGRGQSAHGRLHPGGAIEIPRARSISSISCSPACSSGATSWPARMSGGEQQMCAIGRALMSEPQAAAARRTVRRPGAGHRAAGVRPGAAHPGERAHRAHRRTECPPGAARGGPRLPAGSRHVCGHPEQPANCWKVPRSAKPTSESEACSTSSTSTCWRR